MFTGGDLKGKRVDVKFYTVNDRRIDLNPNVGEDVYLLVFTGSYDPSGSSRGKERPLLMTNVYLFNERELCNSLKEKHVGVASSVRAEYWEKAEIIQKIGLVMTWA